MKLIKYFCKAAVATYRRFFVPEHISSLSCPILLTVDSYFPWIFSKFLRFFNIGLSSNFLDTTESTTFTTNTNIGILTSLIITRHTSAYLNVSKQTASPMSESAEVLPIAIATSIAAVGEIFNCSHWKYNWGEPEWVLCSYWSWQWPTCEE